MEEEITKTEQIQRQLQITLAKQQLSVDAADFLQEHKEQYTPQQLNEIRTALFDGAGIDAIADFYPPEMDAKRMQEQRKRHYIDERTAALLDEVSAKVKRMQQIADDIYTAYRRSETLFHECMEEIKQGRESRNQETEKLASAILAQMKNYSGPEMRKKNLFSAKKSPKDEIRLLIERGKYNPEQLAELTEAYAANLPEEQIQAIAKPENPAQTMKQLRLLYEARNHYCIQPQVTDDKSETHKQWENKEEFQNEESEEPEEDYDESGEG